MASGDGIGVDGLCLVYMVHGLHGLRDHAKASRFDRVHLALWRYKYRNKNHGENKGAHQAGFSETLCLNVIMGHGCNPANIQSYIGITVVENRKPPMSSQHQTPVQRFTMTSLGRPI